MRSESVSKITYYRKQSVEKLYKLLKQKVLIDMRKVKRFRIWQILVLKRKIALFMRKVKETNRRFLQRTLKSIIEVLKKPLAFSFGRIKSSSIRPLLPSHLNPSLSCLKLFQLNLNLQTRINSTTQFNSFTPNFHLKRKSFQLWKSRAYPSSPFLQRKLVLTLSVLGIVLSHRWENLNFAFQKVSILRERIETIPLSRVISRIVHKRMMFAFRKVNQPRFNRRQQEPKVDVKAIKARVITSAFMVEMMIRKKKGFEARQGKLEVLKSFNLWKQLSNENQVPKFIMKRHCRSWACKILAIGLKCLLDKSRRSVFKVFKVEKPKIVDKENFPIDKFIIENQAHVLAKLETQHYNKIREVKKVRKIEKMNKIRVFFWKGLKEWMGRWKVLLLAPDDQQVRTS